jgi:hypothetical protein
MNSVYVEEGMGNRLNKQSHDLPLFFTNHLNAGK